MLSTCHCPAWPGSPVTAALNKLARPGTTGCPLSRAGQKSGHPLHRAPANVAAAKALRPVDLVHGGIGAVLRLANVAAAGGDVEHAAAIGKDAVAVAPGAGMENLHAGDTRGLGEALDLRSLGVSAGIALGRHDHAERGIVGPFERNAIKPGLRGGE